MVANSLWCRESEKQTRSCAERADVARLLRKKEKRSISGNVLVSFPFSGKRGPRPEIERQIQAENDVWQGRKRCT